MTRVHFDFVNANNVPSDGVVQCVPSRRSVTGNTVRLPNAVSVQLANGEATVDLAATSAEWAWRITEPEYALIRYVSITESTDILEYTQLESIDPTSLQVSETSILAWERAVEQANSALATITMAREHVDTVAATVHDFSLDVGQVVTGDHAEATLTGEYPHKTLNLTIPAGEQGLQGVQGLQGAKGDKGDPFTVRKTYDSVAAMKADFTGSDTAVGDFVIINTGNVDDPENATLWVKTESEWLFVTDLSGMQGIKGDTGERGPQGVQGLQGIQGIQGERGVGIATISRSDDYGLDITLTDGSHQQVASLRGAQGEQGPKGDKGDKGDTGPAGRDGKDALLPADNVTLSSAPQQNLEVKGLTISGSVRGLSPSFYVDATSAGGHKYKFYAKANGNEFGIFNETMQRVVLQISPDYALIPVDLRLAGKRIQQVADPTDSTDAATKQYVDAAIAALKAANGLQ